MSELNKKEEKIIHDLKIGSLSAALVILLGVIVGTILQNQFGLLIGIAVIVLGSCLIVIRFMLAIAEGFALEMEK